MTECLPMQKGNCLGCKSDLTHNWGGFNGYCSDCVASYESNKDCIRCPKCGYKWRYLDRYIPDFYQKRQDGRIGQTISCSRCGYSVHNAIYWRRYNKTPHRLEYIRNYRKNRASKLLPCLTYLEARLSKK